jgi:hypothetical protein
MTEAEWLEGTDPQKMLAFLQGKASDRKLRLFAVACCRSSWRFLDGRWALPAVDVAERLADGSAGEEERARAAREFGKYYAAASQSVAESDMMADEAWSSGEPAADLTDMYAVLDLHLACSQSLQPEPRPDEVLRHIQQARRLLENGTAGGTPGIGALVGPYVVSLIRCIFGNPFRPATPDTVWLAWQDRTIPKLAQAAYDDRTLPAGVLDLSRLAILADALEEAGCHDTDILGHCRGPGPHVRGCWLVDLVAGRS